MIKSGYAKMNESYNPIHEYLRLVLGAFIKKTGTHNGGDCGTVAKYIADLLEEMDEKYEFAGELTDGYDDDGKKVWAVGHILIKYDGKYYDGVEGEVNTSGRKIVDRLKDDGRSIGNEKYGWIDYNLVKYKSTSGYKIFMDLSDQLA